MTEQKGVAARMYISPTHGSATVSCSLHTEKELLAVGYAPGYFLTDSELAELKREYFEAGRRVTVFGPGTRFKWQEHDDYESAKQEWELKHGK